MTFKDSSWKMSIVVAAQPHFKNQPMDVTVFWGYGLYTDRIGDYVHKPMKDCTGEEILTELMHQLHMEDQLEAVKSDIINVIPCYMPYVDAHFEPRKMSDRPQVVPAGSTNLGLIGQYVETPEDMVFTEEYSVRTARIAVYTLLGIDRKICPVTPYQPGPQSSCNRSENRLPLISSEEKMRAAKAIFAARIFVELFTCIWYDGDHMVKRS